MVWVHYTDHFAWVCFVSVDGWVQFGDVVPGVFGLGVYCGCCGFVLHTVWIDRYFVLVFISYGYGFGVGMSVCW